ncbi:TRAP transporter small permease [Microbacterium sp.]|uniref:TRAP transporter small permease n=1 Tax=Microbacterium sp. TaxID=51671 RepID=UPI0027329C48|nr:TRAP transporter small permease subunit [Microbacterium sp.]MDP3950269.1 TRAP transporter small permease subunit [Microbacterium sp.]
MNSTEVTKAHGVGKVITRIMMIVGVAAIFAIMAHTLANVFMRFVFNAPIPNAIEVISYWYMLILAYVGFVLAKLAKQAMDAPIIFDSLTWGNRRLLMIFSNALATAFCSIAAYFTLVSDALPSAQIEKTAGASTLPVWPVLFVVPVVFAVLAVLYAIDTVKAVGGHFDAEAEDLDAVLADEDIEIGTEEIEQVRTSEPDAAPAELTEQEIAR